MIEVSVSCLYVVIIDFNCKFLACCNNSDQKTHTICFGFKQCSENPYFTLGYKFLGWFPDSCIIYVEALQPQLAQFEPSILLYS